MKLEDTFEPISLKMMSVTKGKCPPIFKKIDAAKVKMYDLLTR